MSGISTHILDTSTGKPAAAIAVTLERWETAGWQRRAAGDTDADGRCRELMRSTEVERGRYRLVFATGAYFEGNGRTSLYPEVSITFNVDADGGSYHMPLLLNAFGYTTYRGS